MTDIANLIPPPDPVFYRMREDGLMERVDPLTGRVLAIFNDFNQETEIANFIETEIGGERVLVQAGIVTEGLGIVRGATLTQALQDVICEKIIEGVPISRLGSLKGFPKYTTIARWRKENPDFDAAIRYAKKARAEHLRDAAMEVALSADGASKDEIPGKRLAVETLQWGAEKDSPEEYGSKLKIEGQALVALVVETGIRRAGDGGLTQAMVKKEEGIDDSNRQGAGYHAKD